MQDVVELKRRDRTLPGTPEVHFSVLRPQPGVMAEGRVQWVTPHTPDTVWRPDTITTENGAEGLTDMLLCVDDPAGTAARYGRYVGRAAGDARRAACPWRAACDCARSGRACVRRCRAGRENPARPPSAIAAVHGGAGAARRSCAHARGAGEERHQARAREQRSDLHWAGRRARWISVVSRAIGERSVERTRGTLERRFREARNPPNRLVGYGLRPNPPYDPTNSSSSSRNGR